MAVAIVGMGLAGLRAATILRNRGMEVQCFEARDRIGGRAWTVADWGYDAGGEWIDGDHPRMLALVREAGLTLVPSQGPRRIFAFGESLDTDSLWPEARLAEEVFHEKALNFAIEGAEPTLAKLIESVSNDHRARWWLTTTMRSDEGDDPTKVGLWGWLEFYRMYADREGGEHSAFRVGEGMGAIADYLGQELDVRFRAILAKAESFEGGVRLGFLDGSAVDFEAAILTMPPPCVARLSFGPALPDLQARAYAECRMAPIKKIAHRYESAWWKEEGWSAAYWDSPLQQTWDCGATLMAYVCGSEPGPFPAPGGHEPLERRVHDWSDDPFAKGGFSVMPPGFYPLRKHLRTSHGRFVFAGEHTADWMGFFEGALESGERSADEVCDLLGSRVL